MTRISVPIDDDRLTGMVAIWVRERAVSLSVILVFAGVAFDVLGYFDALQRCVVLFASCVLSALTLGTILIGFEVIAFETGSATVEAEIDVNETVTYSNGNSGEEE